MLYKYVPKEKKNQKQNKTGKGGKEVGKKVRERINVRIGIFPQIQAKTELKVLNGFLIVTLSYRT